MSTCQSLPNACQANAGLVVKLKNVVFSRFQLRPPKLKKEDIIDIGPFFGYECADMGILVRARGPFFLGPSARANILQSTPEGPKIRANDIVILVFECTGQIHEGDFGCLGLSQIVLCCSSMFIVCFHVRARMSRWASSIYI
jgi:hypothetical protein